MTPDAASEPSDAQFLRRSLPGPLEAERSSATKFDVVASEVTHAGLLTTLRVDTLRGPDGATYKREIAERPDAVALVPLTSAGEVVLVRQYRHAVGGDELEIPAGLLDREGEAEEVAARRELVEEVGLAAGGLRFLLRFVNSAGWSNEQTSIYVATDLQPADTADDFLAEGEEAAMSILQVPLDEAVAMVHDGRIRDAKTVIGLLLVAAFE